MIKRGGNLLLLDEPSNDLDVDTLRALEDGLEKFPGCAVVISHDRWFLDRIATHILAFEGDSHVEWFEGNFAGLRGRSQAPPRRRRGPAAPDQVQGAAEDPVARRRPAATKDRRAPDRRAAPRRSARRGTRPGPRAAPPSARTGGSAGSCAGWARRPGRRPGRRARSRRAPPRGSRGCRRAGTAR